MAKTPKTNLDLIREKIKKELPELVARHHERMAKKQVEGMRIGWLDSTRAPSHIHRTIDNGVTTVCGHPVKEMTETHDPLFNRSRWAIDPNIPRSIHGKSRYCVTCFKNGGKTIPFFTVGPNKET